MRRTFGSHPLFKEKDTEIAQLRETVERYAHAMERAHAAIDNGQLNRSQRMTQITDLQISAVARAIFAEAENAPRYLFRALDSVQHNYYRKLAVAAINGLRQEEAMQRLADEGQKIEDWRAPQASDI